MIPAAVRPTRRGATLGGWTLVGALVIATLGAGFATGGTAAAGEERRAVPRAATVYAQGPLVEDLQDQMRDPAEAAHYGFTPPVRDIRIGPLRPTYLPPAPDALLGDWVASERAREPRDEWVAVVYQGDTPTNVVGVWEERPGAFELSTFGYGTQLGKALHRSPEGQPVIYEGPIDTWYAFDRRGVTILSGDLPADQIGRTLDWEQFRADYAARLHADTAAAQASRHGRTAILVVTAGVALVLGAARVRSRAKDGPVLPAGGETEPSTER